MREEYRTGSDTSTFLYVAKGREDSSSASMGGGPLTTSVLPTEKRFHNIQSSSDYVNNDLEAVRKVEVEGTFTYVQFTGGC